MIPGNTFDAAHYVQDFDHVVAKGVSDRRDGTRSLEEEIQGIYWGYDGPEELGTPPRLYMQVVLTILDAIEFRRVGALSVDDELRVIAGAGIALAEAGIDAWHYKYKSTHMMWRPAVGVPQIGSPALGTAVPDWRPLGRPETNGMQVELTPDFPAYPSGHATFGAAALHLLRLFLVEKGLATFDADGCDNIDFDFVSDEYDGRNTDPRTKAPRDLLTRRHPTIWDAILENSLSRVYLGVHWQFDGVTKRKADNSGDMFGVPEKPKDLGSMGGVRLGVDIAKKVALSMAGGVTQPTVTASRI